jgi:hypothetical protein
MRWIRPRLNPFAADERFEESEPREGRLEKNGVLRPFISSAGILVVRFARGKCPIGAENPHSYGEN